MRKMRSTASRFIIRLGVTTRMAHLGPRSAEFVLPACSLKNVLRTNPAIDERIPSSEDTRITSIRARSRTYADQVLGCARFHADPAIRKHALRRQYLLRRGTFRRPHLRLRLRHRIPRPRPATAK